MIALLATAALAAEIPHLNAQVFHLSVDGRAGFSLDDGIIAPDRQFAGRVLFHYVNRPLVAVHADGTEVVALSDVVALNVLPSYTLGRTRLGLDVPIYLGTWGSDVEGGALLGDVALDLRVAVLDPDAAPMGLSPTVRLALPVAGDTAPVGSDGLDATFGVAASREQGEWLFAANLGVRLLPEVELENATWGSQLAVRAGASRTLGDNAGVSLELSSLFGFAEMFGNAAGSPSEAMLGGWYRLPANVVLRAGVGTGLTRGIGAPDARVLFGAAYEPSLARDRDHDGLRDRVDACPADAEDLDAYRDDDGCPEPDNDHDGVLDPADACPVVAEDKDGWEDLDGCIDPVTDVTVRVVDGAGKLIEGSTATLGEFVNHGPEGTTGLGAGSYSLTGEAPMYIRGVTSVLVVDGPPQTFTVTLAPEPAPKPTAKVRVVVTLEKIEFWDSIYFDTGKTTIRSQSFSLLDEVGKTLQAHPEVTLVRVEGHTDTRGDAKKNLKLSQGRAEAVVKYLTKAGVVAGRMRAEGLGETRPIDPAENATAWDKNRRVEFIIEARRP